MKTDDPVPRDPATPPSAGPAADAVDAFVFRLYVTEATPASARAVVNARRIFEAHLPGRHRLQIVDIGIDVALAIADQIVAAPTLVRIAPLPLRRFIGDMSDERRLLELLGLPAAPGAKR